MGFVGLEVDCVIMNTITCTLLRFNLPFKCGRLHMSQMNSDMNCVYRHPHSYTNVSFHIFVSALFKPVIHKWMFSADLSVTTYFSVYICVNMDSI